MGRRSSPRCSRSRSRPRATVAHPARLAKDVGDLGKRLSLPAGVGLVVFGVWLVGVSALNLTDTWVLLRLPGNAITLVVGRGVPRPRSRATWQGRRRATDPVIERRIRRIFSLSRVDLVVLGLVVADMVFKRGG